MAPNEGHMGPVSVALNRVGWGSFIHYCSQRNFTEEGFKAYVEVHVNRLQERSYVADARSEGHDCSLEHLLSLMVMLQDQLSTHIQHRPCSCICQCPGCLPPQIPTPTKLFPLYILDERRGF
jgi:hypothetical protein